MRYTTAFMFLGLLACSVSQAATIYLCTAWTGGTFWSSAVCSSQKATIDRISTVPDGMPFQQQVDIAQSQLNAARPQNLLAPPAVKQVASNCSKLVQERRAIDQITEKMIWVPIEQQNANYHQMNQLKADMSRLGCRY